MVRFARTDAERAAALRLRFEVFELGEGLARWFADGMDRDRFDDACQHLLVFEAPGERVPLVEIGSHCRGAVFLDGGALATPELGRAIDRIARGFAGFYFGRFDLRAPSLDDLGRGRGFKIVELNGVTSEATHIYDPRNGLRQAYGVLFEQRRLAFDIGAENRRRGARPASAWTLCRAALRYRGQARLHPSIAAVRSGA